MINLTDSALNAVRNAISTANKPVDGLRIMVEAGGCAGYKYILGLVDAVDPDDTVIERDGVRVFVDNKSHEYLAGTTIDFVIALEGSGFTFENPNAKSSCGCGKSFCRRSRQIQSWREIKVMLIETEDLKQLPTDRATIIKAVIEEIRPNLQRDGGDCQLIEIDGNKILVKLTGACVFCKLSSATLEGIQARLVEKLGEFVRLIPVAGAAKARH